MSVKWISYFFDHTSLEASELLLALAIADHANASGEAWPGVVLLAKKIRLKERRTQSLIKSLESQGYLKVERHDGRGNVAKFHLQRVQSSTPFCEFERVQPGTVKGAIQQQKRVQSGTLPLNNEEPLYEPIQNHETGKVSGSESEVAAGPFIPLRSARKISSKIRPKSDPLSQAFIAFRDGLEDWYCQALNLVSLPPKASTGEQVAWLFENSFSLDDVRRYFDFAAKEKWRQGPVNLGAIVAGIAEWKASKQKIVEPTIEEKYTAATEQRKFMRSAPGGPCIAVEVKNAR